MSVSNTFKPAKDGAGGNFNLDMGQASISGNTLQKVCLASPSTEAFIEPPTHADMVANTAAIGTPMQQTGGTVGSVGSGTIATAAVTVTTSATLLAASRAGRNSLSAINNSTTVIYVGASGVTIATGVPIAGVVGGSISAPAQGALFGIVASGTADVRILETF